jgi:hypothetical protein
LIAGDEWNVGAVLNENELAPSALHVKAEPDIQREEIAHQARLPAR